MEKIKGILRKPWILHEFYEFDQPKPSIPSLQSVFSAGFWLAFSTFLLRSQPSAIEVSAADFTWLETGRRKIFGATLW
jgi:hypothetical protein